EEYRDGRCFLDYSTDEEPLSSRRQVISPLRQREQTDGRAGNRRRTVDDQRHGYALHKANTVSNNGLHEEVEGCTMICRLQVPESQKPGVCGQEADVRSRIQYRGSMSDRPACR